MTAERSRRWTEPPVWCRYCGEEITACIGDLGDWMHVETRTERCEGRDTVAQPQPPGAVTVWRPTDPTGGGPEGA